MDPPKVDIHAHFDNAFRKQNNIKVESEHSGLLSCPYGHSGRIFQSIQQLLDHARIEHTLEVSGLNDEQSHSRLRDAIEKAR
jgi:hypothetical protein